MSDEPLGSGREGRPDDPDRPGRSGQPWTEDLTWPAPDRWSDMPARDEEWAVRLDRPPVDDGPVEARSWRHNASDTSSRMRVPWSWGDGVALIVLVLVANFVAAVAFSLAGIDLIAEGGIAVAWFAVVTFLIALACAYLWLRARDRWTWQLAGPVRPSARHLGVGVVAGALGWLGFTIVVAASLTVIDPEELPGQETLDLLAVADGWGLVVAFLGVVVLAAVVEELVYRGVFFQALRSRLGFGLAAVVSSLVWALMHFELLLGEVGWNLAGLVPVGGIALFGIWLSWLLHRTGSILVPIAAHAAFNAIALGLAFVAEA